MPTLSCFYAIYTDGRGLNEGFAAPPGTDVFLGEMGTLLVPGPQDELFGPNADLFKRARLKRGFLLGFRRRLRGRAETFFSEARAALLEATQGLEGVGLDVLRLWPFPLATAADDLPDELLAEDLFAVGFTELGPQGFRAETVGFSKLGQRELSFEFADRPLLEEAGLLCGHLADWLLEHSRRLAHGDSLGFGFDRLSFRAAEGEAGGPYRGWHPPLIQRLLPAHLFPGLGVLEVRAVPPGQAAPLGDLTVPLRRALEQRRLLEELDLSGDSPHATSTARVQGFISELQSLVALREESAGTRDSGWRFRSTAEGASGELGVMSVADLARRAPDLIRYLALPHGIKLTWDATGRLEVDRSRVDLSEDTLDES